MRINRFGTRTGKGLLGLVFSCLALSALGAGSSDDEHGHAALSEQPTPYLTEKELGERTPPLIELGGDFLGTGNIKRGFTLPTGAVWSPRLWVYGTLRSAIQGYSGLTSDQDTLEWTNRLDLFANLQLTGTERLLVGFTPTHRDNRFSGYTFEPDDRSGTDNELNFRVRTLFFEGDLAELFPRWDVFDNKKNDVGFTVGRQAVLFQDGMSINDLVDAVGFSKNNIRFEGVPWLVNMRTSFLYAWNEINRENNQEDSSADLYALFAQLDTLKSTIDFDLIYVEAEEQTGDLVVTSLDFIQRIGKMNSTFRIAGSLTPDAETSVASDGLLLFSELSWTPAFTHNNLYLNLFMAIDDYTSASRDSLAGGPLGRVGLLYAASGLGTYPAPLSNRASDAMGFSLGYQLFFDNNRRQTIFEIGGRTELEGPDDTQYGVAARFQQALGRRFVFQVDGFVTDSDLRGSDYGARVEFLTKF